jgi:phosphohistidine phosphatase
MKMLYVIRHAKSSWKNPLMDDFDRPLNKRGEHDAPRMGKRLKKKNITADLLLSSPAKRALTTCQEIAAVLNYSPVKIKTERKLYHASEETILQVIKLCDDKHHVVMYFGHNPGLTDFVNQLTDTVIDNVPTCGIVACSLPIDSWKDLEWKQAKIEFFDYPKMEKP